MDVTGETCQLALAASERRRESLGLAGDIAPGDRDPRSACQWGASAEVVVGGR